MFNKGSKRKANQEKKNKYASKSLTRIVVSLFVAIIAWVGATSFEAYLLSDKNTTAVVMAVKNVPEGTLIDETNRNTYFATKAVNTNLVTDTTITDLANVSGKATTAITSGEIVTTHRFDNTLLANEKFKDPVEITFTVSAADKAICGEVRRGDIVDIIGISTDATGATTSKVLKSNAYIIEAYDASGKIISDGNTSAQAISFKIRVERNEAASYNMMFNYAEITVVKLMNSEETETIK